MWIIVAPRVGAWIETWDQFYNVFDFTVAPRVGAWIETSQMQRYLAAGIVAPRVGAWIETNRKKLNIPKQSSRPSRGGVD